MSLWASHLRPILARQVSIEQKLWVRRLRRGELAWQPRRRRLQRTIAHQRRGGATSAQRKDETATVVFGPYDAAAELRISLADVRRVLDASDIDSVELPRLKIWDPLLVVRRPDLIRVLGALTELGSSTGWNVVIQQADRRHISARLARRAPEKVATIRLYRRLLGPNGRQLSTGAEHITIEPWDEVGPQDERVDGGFHTEGTVHRHVTRRGPLLEYLTPEIWEDVVRHRDRVLNWPLPHLYTITEPIDLVYTWVDGNDLEWQKRKLAAQGMIDPSTLNETAAAHSRYANRDELRYSLRSVEYYASWYNHIYLVTDGQVPEWLDVDHPRISVVDHREIFHDPSVLPVFNSHAIESQLHHIEGLSERYLYCNDDFMFMRPTNPEMFFTSNGLSRYFPSTAPLDLSPASHRDAPVLSAAKRNREFVMTEHGRTVSNKFKHTPHAQMRSLLVAWEEQHPKMFADVASSRFRHPDDYSIPAALYHFHAYAQGRAIPGHLSYSYLDIGRPNLALLLDRLKRQRKIDVLTLNDTHLDEADEQVVAESLRDFFDDRFPCPSSFERA